VIFAHVLGVPVEETLPALVPLAAVVLIQLRASLRRLRRPRRSATR
jgi:hypothetical protein